MAESIRFGKSNQRVPAQIKKDKLTITEHYLQGMPQYKIAEIVGVSPSTITHELKQIRKMWVDATIKNFDERQAMEIAKLDKIEFEAWEAWERSKEGTTETKEVTSGEESNYRKQVSSAGSSKFLELILKCVDKRCKIFGLDAPVKVDWRQELPSGIDPDEIEQKIMAVFTRATEEGEERLEVSQTITGRQKQTAGPSEDFIETEYDDIESE